MGQNILVSATSTEALLSGDHEAFSEVVRQESPRLFSMILRIVRDEEDAQSVLQETFFQAYIGLATFRHEAKLSTWLYSIGRNQAYRWLRKKRRHTIVEVEKVDRIRSSVPRDGHSVQQSDWSPYTQLERAERNRLIHMAISSLSSTHRQVVTLRDLRELSTAETARVLNISEGAVRVRLCRARRALRGLLRESLFADKRSYSHH